MAVHRRVSFAQLGDLDQLYVEKVDTPAPGPGEVLIRVEAAAVNHLDLDMLAGTSRFDLPLPHTLGFEAAGVITETAPDVADFAPGDRVMIATDIVCRSCRYCLEGRDNLCRDAYRPGWTHPGAYSEYMIAPARGAYRLPDHVSFEDAAAVQVSFGTAWHMLIDRGHLQLGEWVLVNGAAGSIGQAAVQLAKLAGARVIAVSASPERRRKLAADGADGVADYSSDTFVEEVMDLTGGAGVDMVYEHVGGDVLRRSLECVREGGRVLTCGGHGGELSEFDVIPFFRKELTIIGSNGATQADVRCVLGMLCDGRLRPTIAATFPLEETAAALQMLKERQNYGRVLVLPNQDQALAAVRPA